MAPSPTLGTHRDANAEPHQPILLGTQSVHCPTTTLLGGGLPPPPIGESTMQLVWLPPRHSSWALLATGGTWLVASQTGEQHQCCSRRRAQLLRELEIW